MVTMACVLRSGGEYTPEHLYQMVDKFHKHNPGVHVQCLTDMEIDHPAITPLPLKHNWPGWWSKIELFRPGLFDGPTIYMDIDTATLGSIEFDYDEFTMLPAAYRPRGGINSSIMAWREPPTHIYEKFARNPDRWMATYRTTQRWGDQGFIRDSLGQKPLTFGEQFRSYKAHCRRRVPAGTSVVYFHGRPKPWQVELRHG